MDDSRTPDGGLTPPGPPSEPEQPAFAVPPPRTPPASTYLGSPQPAAPAPGTDKGLGWTAFGLGLVFCIPCLPLAGVVVAVIALARRRFRPRWAVVVALVAGLIGTGLQVAVLASPGFWEGIQDGINDSLEEEADDARRSGEPTEIAPSKLRDGDCLLDPALKGVGTEQVETQTVTLLKCRDKHDLEVYATLKVSGDEYPGEHAIDKVATGCFRRFETFIGKPYSESELEIFYYFPTAQSWRLLGDKTVTCVVGHPERQVRGSLEGSRR